MIFWWLFGSFILFIIMAFIVYNAEQIKIKLLIAKYDIIIAWYDLEIKISKFLLAVICKYLRWNAKRLNEREQI